MAKGRFNKKPGSAALNITSMMDMFTIILVFLLKSFSADGSILTNADNLVLPNSASKLKPQDVNLQLAVTDSMVLLDNRVVVPTDVISKMDRGGPQIISLLEEQLKVALEEEEKLVKEGKLNRKEPSIIIQVDKNINFDILYKIMRTCGAVGYTNMNFAVMERDD